MIYYGIVIWEWNYSDCSLWQLWWFSTPWFLYFHQKMFHCFKDYLMMKLTLA
jgi:hypothetical protein